ncbi:MAG: hypothetical protein AAGA95_06005 [Pseudomonadota bacterium]
MTDARDHYYYLRCPINTPLWLDELGKPLEDSAIGFYRKADPETGFLTELAEGQTVSGALSRCFRVGKDEAQRFRRDVERLISEGLIVVSGGAVWIAEDFRAGHDGYWPRQIRRGTTQGYLGDNPEISGRYPGDNPGISGGHLGDNPRIPTEKSSGSLKKDPKKIRSDQEEKEEKAPKPSKSTVDLPSTDDDQIDGPKKIDGEIQEAFDLWVKLHRTKACKLSRDRRDLLGRRIREHGFETVMDAIRGAAKSDFHMGRDSKTGGKRYNTLKIILRDTDQIEGFQELDPNPPRPTTDRYRVASEEQHEQNARGQKTAKERYS